MNQWLNGAAACGLLALAALGAQADTARGVVFEDQNGNGQRDSGEPGLQGIGVSNGADVVLTGEDGGYALDVSDDAIIFVIKPTGYQVPIAPKTNIPRHYYIHKPAGSPDFKFAGVVPTGPLPESIDFALRKVDETGPFTMVCLGDTQPRNQREVDHIAHDVVEELIGAEAAFGVTLGDIVFDDLSVLEPLTGCLGLVGVPWHYVIGNHDINFDSPDQLRSDETYERLFGPSYYAYNYGGVHFIVMNNVWWDSEVDKYHAELGEQQIEFIKNDLRHVPKETLIVLMMHIPLTEVRDKDALFGFLDEYPHTFSLSAHTHDQKHLFLGEEHHWHGKEPHHHLVHATACGSWWRGIPDELGIPNATMDDGTPNGYSLIEFDGAKFSVRFKAARRPADYQMNVYAPEMVKSAESGEASVVVNVFSGSEKSIVEMRMNGEGEWTRLENVYAKDPFTMDTTERQRALYTKIARDRGAEVVTDEILREVEREYIPILGRGLPDASDTNHIWTGPLPENVAAGYHVINVRTTDMFGQSFEAKRVLRVEP